jgi:aminocarboxymuconate-semialdehyde decarboxylase
MIIHPKCILRNTRNFDKCRLSTVIDIHSHFLPHSWPNFLEKYGADNGPWPWMRHSADNKTKAMLMVGNEEFRPVESRCWDVEWRLKDMDHDLIDHQIISNTPVLFQYHRRVDQVMNCIIIVFSI